MMVCGYTCFTASVLTSGLSSDHNFHFLFSGLLLAISSSGDVSLRQDSGVADSHPDCHTQLHTATANTQSGDGEQNDIVCKERRHNFELPRRDTLRPHLSPGILSMEIESRLCDMRQAWQSRMPTDALLHCLADLSTCIVLKHCDCGGEL